MLSWAQGRTLTWNLAATPHGLGTSPANAGAAMFPCPADSNLLLLLLQAGAP